MNKKDRKRRSFKNKTGATVLSLLLVAALAVGGLSTYATEEDLSADAVATEETVPDDTGAVTEPGAEDTHPDPEITDDAADTTGDLANTDSQDSGKSAKSDSQDSEASAQTETTVDTSKLSTAAANASQNDADDTDNEDDEETGDTLHEDGLSDDTADVETASDWEATLPDELTGVWADDLIEVAKSQLGYKESTKNYRVNDAGKHKGYTRYGAWYGDPYGDWCAMFVSFCLHYTDIPRDEFPEAASCWAWTKTLDKLDMYEEADSGYEPVPGDLIFFDNNSKNEKPVDHVGIVTEIAEETDEGTGEPVTVVKTIEGNSGNMVREREYDITDDRIVGYGVLPENPDLAPTAVTFTLYDNEQDIALEGAEFTLDGETLDPMTEDGITIDGGELEAGDYTFTETEAPEGYEPLEDDFTLSVGEDGAITVTSGNDFEVSEDGSEVVIYQVQTLADDMGSDIYKLMTDNSTDVATGSTLTFIVERYDASAGTWSPASGVSYVAMDGYTGGYDTSGCTATSAELATNLDGKIVLTKTASGYPYIHFTDDVVYANVAGTPEDGTLRVIESTLGTDAAWGQLSAYGKEGWSGTSLTLSEADTFYNTNNTDLTFEIEKELTDSSGDTDDDFTFQLIRVISASESPITSMDQILESVVGANVAYTVYEAGGTYVGEGVTTSDGTFTLKAGQYAVFEVPEDTIWVCYEDINPGYTLDDLTKNAAENATIVDQVNAVVQNAHSVAKQYGVWLGEVGSTTDDAFTVTEGTVGQNKATYGVDYTTTLTANDGYTLPDSVVVTVDGETLNANQYTYDSESGALTVQGGAITGDIVIIRIIVRYAVKVWGIQQDTYQKDDGSMGTAGLTFGPATGADHLESYVSRETVIANGGSHASTYCIHDMTWDEIIEQSAADPTVFADCKANGCTKAVELTPNETLFNMTTVDNYLGNASYTGDGVSTLYYLLNYGSGTGEYCYWNQNYSGYSSSDRANIYSRSRIRTTLTGDSTDIEAQLEAGGNNYYYTDAYPLLHESNCLLSCFPESLQEAVVPRTTLNTGNATSGTSANDKTTYDKLFLFSMKETGLTYAYDDGGGDDYGVNAANTDRIAYEFSGTNATTSSSRGWWSRSRYSYYNYSACSVLTSGAYNHDSVNYYNGLSPGFCIK